MASSRMLRRSALVRTDVWEEHSASFIRVTRNSVLGRTLALTRNRRTPRRITCYFLISGVKLNFLKDIEIFIT
jgi:hypothetical protein